MHRKKSGRHHNTPLVWIYRRGRCGSALSLPQCRRAAADTRRLRTRGTTTIAAPRFHAGIGRILPDEAEPVRHPAPDHDAPVVPPRPGNNDVDPMQVDRGRRRRCQQCPNRTRLRTGSPRAVLSVLATQARRRIAPPLRRRVRIDHHARRTRIRRTTGAVREHHSRHPRRYLVRRRRSRHHDHTALH